MKASMGTLRVLGLKKCKTDVDPTTAYLLSGESCSNNCKFCSQAKDYRSDKKRLSRIAWPETDVDHLIQELGKAYKQQKIKRACIQVLNHSEAMEQAKHTIDRIVKDIKMPTCVSANVHSLADVKALLDLNVDRVSIALDAVTPTVYEQIKGGLYAKRLALILDAASTYPNRISTHVIVGLGETEQDMLHVIDLFLKYSVTVALFAFTPVKGAEMELCEPPAIETYRRIQTAFYLLKNKKTTHNGIKYNEEGQLIDYGLSIEEVKKILMDSKGVAFETTGCDDCNRPYYNERPGGIMYNYPRALNHEELQQAVRLALVFT